MSMTLITANLTGNFRYEEMDGRKYLVAPMVMMAEGVHNGSKGPLFYPERELSKTPAVWNHKPIVVYHPEDDGVAVSACSEKMLKEQKIGIIMNTVWDGKLRAEAWLDVERTKEVDSRVITAVINGQMMEVSTGMFTDDIPETGTWNEETYTHVATNYRPDHLAILPDQIGACSIADGAGLLQLNSDETETVKAFLKKHGSVGWTMLHDTLRRVSHDVIVNADKTHSTLREQLVAVLRNSVNDFQWVEDVSDSLVYFSRGDYDSDQPLKLYQQKYVSDDSGVELVGDMVEVVRSVVYTPVGEPVLNKDPSKSKKMNKAEKIDKLVTNADFPWEESDREWLDAQDDARLDKLLKEPAATNNTEGGDGDGGSTETKTTPEPQSAGAGVGKPLSFQEWIGLAPQEAQDMFKQGIATHNAEKARLVQELVANTRCTFTVDQLNAKPLDELRSLVALAAPVSQPATPVANFYGIQGAVPTANSGVKTPEPMGLPDPVFGSAS